MDAAAELASAAGSVLAIQRCLWDKMLCRLLGRVNFVVVVPVAVCYCVSVTL